MTTWTDEENGGTVWSDDEAAGTALGAANGSSLVGFVQSGTATSEDLQGKVRRDVGTSPQDYMSSAQRTAVAGSGGGTNTNWTTALTALDTSAINGTYKKPLHVPAGIYDLTSGLAPETLQDIAGESRWGSRLMFDLTATGACIDLAGASTNDKINSSISDLRIDGTGSTDANVVGVECNWNQSQTPLTNRVTIYGGYEAGGANTGLKNGMKYTEDGSNWNNSHMHLAIEGCHGDGLVMDVASGGALQAINFYDARIENNNGRNVYVLGPNDDTIGNANFIGGTIELASYDATGVTSEIHLEGCVLASLAYVWIEGGQSPNLPTYEVYVPTGRASIHSCVIAWSATGVYCGGEVTFTGKNTIRSSTAGIHIPAGGTCNIVGEAVTFLGAGTPITFSGSNCQLNWVRDRHLAKTDSYTVTTADFGTTFTNVGALKDITFTIPDGPDGANFHFVNGSTSIRTPAFRWVASGSGTNEYYLQTSAGGDPGVGDPTNLYSNGTLRTEGTAGALTDTQWDYADNDTLGYSTIYYRRDAGDPDAMTTNNIVITYKITVDPSSSMTIQPSGSDAGDAVVSDGAIGSSLTLRAIDAWAWLQQNKTGTWT